MTCQKWEVKKTDYSSGRKRLNEDLDKIQSCQITYKAFLKKKSRGKWEPFARSYETKINDNR